MSISTNSRHQDAYRPRGPRYLGKSRQGGAVLIVSLILLVVMTLLGLSSMSTTSLQEKMAANSQEGTRAFQAAESGLAIGYNQLIERKSVDSFVITPTDIDADGYTAHSTKVDFVVWTAPPVGSGYSKNNFAAAMFQIESAGSTDTGTTRTHYNGAYRIATKAK